MESPKKPTHPLSGHQAVEVLKGVAVVAVLAPAHAPALGVPVPALEVGDKPPTTLWFPLSTFRKKS